jgi:hypothetical protein
MERIRKESEMLMALAEKAGQNPGLSVGESVADLPENSGKQGK